MGISQPQLVTDILKSIARQGIKDVITAKKFNAIIEGANLIVKKFDAPYIPARLGMGLTAWVNTDDVGASSKFMVVALTGGCAGGNWDSPTEILSRKDYPLDGDDFSRCYKLLLAVPEFASRLSEVATAGGKVWMALVLNWPELERLYLADVANKTNTCTKKIRELIEAAR